MPLHLFDIAGHKAEFSDMTGGELGFCESISKNAWLREFAGEELQEAAQRHRSALHAILREGEFPRPLRTHRTAHLSDEERTNPPAAAPDELASTQVFTAHVLCRLGDPIGEEALVFYLQEAGAVYRGIALYNLCYCRDKRFGPLSGRVLEAIRRCIHTGDEDAVLAAHVCVTLRLTQFIPDLLDARARASETAVKSLTQQLVCMTSDQALSDRLLAETTPGLAHDELWGWVRGLSAEISRNWSGNGPQRLRNWARGLLDRWLAGATLAEISKSLEQDRYYWKPLLAPQDRPYLERFIASPEADPDGSRRRTAEEFQARLDPQRRLDYLLSGEFSLERICGELAGTVQPAETDRIVAYVAKVTRKKEKLDERSVRFLWTECGEAGQTLLLKKLAACTTLGLRTLVWLVEGLSAEAAATALVQAGLSDQSVSELLKRHAEFDPEIIRDPGGPKAAMLLLGIAHRHHGFDIDSESIPPRYDLLLAGLARATAGVLKITDVKVDPAEPADDYLVDPFHVQFLCHGRSWSFDAANASACFDQDAVFRVLAELLEYVGSRERFYDVLTGEPYFDLVFGPPEALGSYAERFALPIEAVGTYGGEAAFREAYMTRIRQAAKRIKQESAG